jgi:hypothetical protein
MTYGHHSFSRVGGRYLLQKVSSSLQQGLLALDIVRPHLTFQVRNEATRKAAPVALAQHGRRRHRQSVGLSNNLGRLNGTLQVA